MKSRKEQRTHPVLSSLPPQRARKGKIVSAEEAIRVIQNDDTVATGGFVGTGFPEELAVVLEQYFLENNKPKNLLNPTLYLPK